jgi:3-deoxy-D-manno-octulosonic-acid transferase
MQFVSILLDIAYGAGLAAASPYLAFKLLTDRRWRGGVGQRFGRIPAREGDTPCVWIHGPSVGEILAAKPLVTMLKEHVPEWDVAISTTTPEGRAQAEKRYGNHPFLFPMDLTCTVGRVLDRIRPDCVVLMERDLVLVANGIVSESMVRRFRLLNRFFGGTGARRTLEEITVFCVQSELYASRLEDLGMAKEKICVTGSMKYDSLCASFPPEKQAALRKLLQLEERDWLLVAGSTHPGEEKAVLDAFAKLRRKYDNLRLVIVPRHINRAADVERAIAEKGYPHFRKTTLDAGGVEAGALKDAVVVVDTIGDLLGLYSIASAAFVGGSLTDRGGQNMLEPVALGVPTLFGPHVKNFQDSADLLLAADGAKTVRDTYELTVTLDFLRDNPVKSADMALAGREAVTSRRGATEKTLEKLLGLLFVKDT